MRFSHEEFLPKSDKATVNVNRLRITCTEIYKPINNLNPDFMILFFFQFKRN